MGDSGARWVRLARSRTISRPAGLLSERATGWALESASRRFWPPRNSGGARGSWLGGLLPRRRAVLPQRGRHRLSAGGVVVALIASRLASPSPPYDVARRASGAALGGLFGTPPHLLNDDRLGRCLEALCPHVERLRGAIMLRAIERFGLDAARLHLDLTALRVAGAYERSALVDKGCRPIAASP